MSGGEMNIKDFTKAYAIKSDLRGAASFLGTLAVYLLSLIWAAGSITQLWLFIPLVVVLAFASVRLYVLQHDCGHHSLYRTKRLNDLAGHVLSVFSLTPYRVMQHNHNLHHAYLGNLDHRETTEVFTMTLAEWQVASPLSLIHI